jgi:hypothetical protein
VTHVYEGVGLEQLIPTLSEGEGIRIEFGPRHAVITVLMRELDSQVKPMVVDKIDGRTFRAYSILISFETTRQTCGKDF